MFAPLLPAPPPLLYRDDDLLVVAKPAGLLVHRSALDAHNPDSVLDRLRQAAAALGLPATLAPAHRLDKGTSGLLVLCLHAQAARALGAALEHGQVRKRYLALVRGWPAPAQTITHPLARDPERPSAGQTLLPARTEVQRLARVEWPFQVNPQHPSSRYALVNAWPHTGRRHQIRRHLKHISHPLVGDATHGKGAHNRAVAAWLAACWPEDGSASAGEPSGASSVGSANPARLWLHAAELWLPHPRTGHTLHLHAPVGPEWQQLAHTPGWCDDAPAALR